MTIPYIYFIYGLSVMFYSLMTWFFMNKNREMVSRLVALLMIVLTLQCIKDLFFIVPDEDNNPNLWMIITSVDMVAVPLYASLLIELCRPGYITWRLIVLHEVPFVLFPILLIITYSRIFYYADVVWAWLYGFGAAVWAVKTISKYHKLLKQRFSYEEKIDLNWLRYILFSFFAVLSLWIADCFTINLNIEALYMVGTILLWMNICYFIYRHESVINELSEPILSEVTTPGSEDNVIIGLSERILNLFDKELIFLNPKLSLSDVATMANSNRTYISRFFNDSHGKSFFEFVNEYRVRHAKSLLKSSDEKLDAIAEQSGFRSRQSFHRVFIKFAGCTPERFRASINN